MYNKLENLTLKKRAYIDQGGKTFVSKYFFLIFRGTSYLIKPVWQSRLTVQMQEIELNLNFPISGNKCIVFPWIYICCIDMQALKPGCESGYGSQAIIHPLVSKL